MTQFDWNATKNQIIIQERGISFEEVVFAVMTGGLLDDIKHPNTEKYPNQRVLIVELDGYAYIVPYIRMDEMIFLKTVIPSRKATKKYLRGRYD
jgi:uncharacterized DUF497 family protein